MLALLSGQRFPVEGGIDAAEEVSGGTALIADHGVDMLPFAAAGQVAGLETGKPSVFHMTFGLSPYTVFL